MQEMWYLKISECSLLGEWNMCAKYTSQVLNMSSLLLPLPSIVNFGTRRKDV